MNKTLLVLILIAAGIGWYFYNNRKNEGNEKIPGPPDENFEVLDELGSGEIASTGQYLPAFDLLDKSGRSRAVFTNLNDLLNSGLLNPIDQLVVTSEIIGSGADGYIELNDWNLLVN